MRAESGPASTKLGQLVSPTLVGREAELGLLLAAMTAAPAVAVVEGEAGVGKTRLVGEALLAPELRTRRRLVGACQPLREPLPFGPVIEALRGAQGLRLAHEPGPIAGALRPLIPELSDQLPPALPPLVDAPAERHRLFRSIAEVFRALGPAVCVLEDLHWSDEGTGDLLRFLVSRLPDQLSLVLTYRAEELPVSSPVHGLASRVPPGVGRTRISLAPLGRAEVRKLVKSMLEVEDVSAEFSDYLHERTLGVPFAVEEVLGLLADRRDIVRRNGRWARRTLDRLEVPEGIRDSILERLARVSPDARRVTRAVAVVGVPAEEDVVREVAGLAEGRAVRGLSEALSLGLLRETSGGLADFRHALARQAVYEAIAAPERRRLHLRAARRLEREPEPIPLAQVAHHCREAGAHKRWLRHAETAADLALSVGNAPAASELLVDALSSADTPALTRARLAVKLGRAALGSLDHGSALAVLRRILQEKTLPAGVRGEVRLYVGLLLDNHAGQASAGFAEIARAVPELRRRPGLAAQAMSVLAVPMAVDGHLTAHLGWMKRALETAARVDDPVLKTGVLVNRATTLMHVGDPEAWRAVFDLPDEAESAGERRQLVRASGNLAHACTCIGHYARADSFLTRARRLADEANDPYLALSLESTRVFLDWSTGRWAGLESRARRLSQDTEDIPRVSAEADLVLGSLLLAHGEILEATAHLRTAREIALTSGSIPVAAAATVGLARILLARGSAERAAEQALDTIALVRSKGIWVWGAEIASVAVEALCAEGRGAEAADLVEELARGLRSRDAPAARAALSACRAQLAGDAGDFERAARGFSRAERAWLGLPRPYEAACCREARGLAQLEAGRQSIDVLTEALAGFQELEASWDAARVRRSLREHGVIRPWRGGRRGYGSRLSPREQEVARQAALGRTNREIAEVLVLSPRTVETHLAKAMRKLGVRSRKALIAEHDVEKVP
jgi:DNA-binding CsgD family transcriptional regulator/tetratricopeptide (TPR) repeat protein